MRLGNGFRVLIATVIGFASPASAQQTPVLVELFTSQGCIACPPADKLMEALADRDDIIALALHVDYWDYIGWVDSFGQAQFSDRQKNYARVNGRASVYTPQMIIGGIDEVKGSSRAQVMGTIATHLGANGAQDKVRLTLSQGERQELIIEARAEQNLASKADVHLVRYRDSERVEILGGENAGRSVTYRNIVTAWDNLTTWDGMQPLRYSVIIEGDEAVVVVIQQQNQGPVLATARRR